MNVGPGGDHQRVPTPHIGHRELRVMEILFERVTEPAAQAEMGNIMASRSRCFLEVLLPLILAKFSWLCRGSSCRVFLRS